MILVFFLVNFRPIQSNFTLFSLLTLSKRMPCYHEKALLSNGEYWVPCYDALFWLLYTFYRETDRFSNPFSKYKMWLKFTSTDVLFWVGTIVVVFVLTFADVWKLE